MGLFSKLFSREGEEPPEADGQHEQTAGPEATGPGGEDGVKREESVAGANPSDGRAGGGGVDKAEAAQSVSTDKHSKRSATETAGAAQQNAAPGKKTALGLEPPLSAADKARKAGEAPKRDGAALRPPPSVGSSTGSGTSAANTVRAPLPAAAKTATNKHLAQTQAGLGGKVNAEAPRAPDVAAKPAPAVASVNIAATVTVDTPAVSPSNSPLEAAVDAAMAALLDTGTVQPNHNNGDHHAADQRAVAATFADMAKVHAHPLRELMFQLSVGRTPRQWASACRPVLRPLFDAATQIGLLELVGALGAFDAALERAAGDTTAHIGPAAAEALSGAYERLRQQLPDAFSAADRADSRRMILLESLLLQIPSVHRRTLAKLHAAGLSSLPQLCQASPDELSAVAGIDRELAQAVVEHIQRFERERSHVDPNALRTHLQERLRSSAIRLTQLQAKFEQAEEEDSMTRKREARREREAAVLELDLLFAELGDVDVIEELKHCPVRGKIRRVESYLEQLQVSA